MSKFYLKISEEISFISKNIIFNDAVIIDLWYFYGEQNKSRWEGGKKNKKGVNIFSKKGRVFKGGHTVAKCGEPKIFLARANCAPPLNKSPVRPRCAP